MLALILAGRAFLGMAELSWYDPALGGINCDHECLFMGNGMLVEPWYDRAVACPVEFPRGTRFIVDGSRWGLADGTYYCWDGGGRIVFLDDGSFRLDLLRREPIWGETLEVLVVPPPVQVVPPGSRSVYLDEL